jgi:predicted nucleic acid-binding protein
VAGQRGRPPLPRGVVAFDARGWTAPEVAALDTNVVAEALLPAEAEHAVCAAVMADLANAGTTVVFNELLEIELWQVLFTAALRERHPTAKLRHVRFDERVRPRAARLLAQGKRSWEQMLSTLTYVRAPLSEVADDVAEVMQTYGLESNDSVHAATLAWAGTTDFLTRDGGFAKLPPGKATLHTTTTRLRNTRRRRQRAGY